MLEVSAGTGRNIAYYNPEMVTAVTMTDGSKHMLWHAQQKHSQQNAKLPIRFCLADAQAMLTQPDLPHPNVARPESDASQTSAAQSDKRLSSYSPEPQVFFPQQFDTVVDTFGLCSHKDPVAALKVCISTTLNYRMAAYPSCVRCILWHGVLERCLSAKMAYASIHAVLLFVTTAASDA